MLEERGPGCAICDGFGGMPVNGTWTICPNCSTWDMGGQHYRDINNRSVVMVDPEKFVQGVRRIRDLTEQRDALVAALEERDTINAGLATRTEAAERLVAAARDVIQQAQGMTVIEDNITGIIVDLDALATDLAAYDAIAQRDTPPGAEEEG
jgi:hypothetical protein